MTQRFAVVEWSFDKHGTAKCRAWRKLHISLDAKQRRDAFDLTDKEVDDASHVAPLLERLARLDRSGVLAAVLARKPNASFIVPPCRGAVPRRTAATLPAHMRSKVEAAISQYKRVIGDILKSRDDARRVTEVAIAVKSLSRLRDLGQAICIRVA